MISGASWVCFAFALFDGVGGEPGGDIAWFCGVKSLPLLFRRVLMVVSLFAGTRGS